MNTGAWRRALMTRSIVPLPRIGRELAVQETTMSCSCSRSGSSRSSIDRALKRCARCSARSSVRFATVIARGCCAAKCVAQSSIISPAPISSTLVSRRDGKIRPASFTDAAAIDTTLAPMPVLVRTSFATANERWKSRDSVAPSVPASSARRTASFIWPRICGSPSTIESRPAATRNAWRTASSRGRV